MRRLLLILLLLAALPAFAQESPRPHARDLGLEPGVFSPGPLNALTDVEGVRVGHFTLIEGEDIRTGATAIVPHGGNLFQEKVPAAIVVGNGFGKLIGATQVNELGQLETPILLTNTLNVWEAAAALVEHTLAQPGNEAITSVNPVVGETNDDDLNNIRRRPLRTEHFRQALRAAKEGPVEEGAVGGGTGTTAFGWKGGLGTSSRRLPETLGGFTVGVLVQTNFDGILTMDGVPVGRELGRFKFRRTVEEEPKGSCMIVVGTNAPLNARQLNRLGKRALAGMARAGASFYNGSGDYVIVFSTAEKMRIPHARPAGATNRPFLPDGEYDGLLQAVAEATEEAIYNSLLRATNMRGYQGREVEALPIEAVRRILKKYGRGD